MNALSSPAINISKCQLLRQHCVLWVLSWHFFSWEANAMQNRWKVSHRVQNLPFFYITCKLGIVRAPGKYEERYWIVLNRAKDDEPLRKRSALDTADKAWISYGCKSHWKKMAQALAAQRNDSVAAKLVYRPCGETIAMRTVLGSSFCPTVWKPHSPLFFLLWVFFALKNVSCCPAKNKIKK